MRDGLTIIDTDTHVWPSVEVLKRYADQKLLDRWDDELAHYERRVELPLTYGDPDGPWTNLSTEPRGFLREIGERSQLEEKPAIRVHRARKRLADRIDNIAARSGIQAS